MPEQYNGRILLVEDDEDIRAVYAEVLRDSNFEVLEASDGDVGLKKALSEDWDLLLLDIMLPGQDGVQILKYLKENFRLKERPIVLLTNLGSQHVIEECFNLGANGYLIKSEITPDKVVAEVQNFLSNK